jgi:hypothetical protein
MSFFDVLKDKVLDLLPGHEELTDSALDQAQEAVDPQIAGEQVDGVIDSARNSADGSVGT